MPSPYVHSVPAVTAGTPHRRSFAASFPYAHHQYVRELRIYNRSTVEVVLTINGDPSKTLRVAASDTVDRSTEGEEIRLYEVDAASNIAADLVDVYEYGGIHDHG